MAEAHLCLEVTNRLKGNTDNDQQRRTAESEAGKLATVFHAGTKRNENGEIVNNGGRVLGVTACGTDLKDAVAKAYAGCEPISWTDMHKRTDIGKVWVD